MTPPNPAPSTQYPKPITQHPIPNTQYPTPNTQNPVPNTQYPIPSTQQMKTKSYKDLEIYNLSFKLAQEIHELSLKFPKFEMYEEGSQIRRSSKSIPSCIAEGWGRRYYKNDFIKFLIYALASCDETKVHLDFVAGCHYITEDQHKHYIERYNVLGKKINKYMQYVMKSYLSPKDNQETDPGIAENPEHYSIEDE